MPTADSPSVSHFNTLLSRQARQGATRQCCVQMSSFHALVGTHWRVLPLPGYHFGIQGRSVLPHSNCQVLRRSWGLSAWAFADWGVLPRNQGSTWEICWSCAATPHKLVPPAVIGTSTGGLTLSWNTPQTRGDTPVFCRRWHATTLTVAMESGGRSHRRETACPF